MVSSLARFRTSFFRAGKRVNAIKLGKRYSNVTGHTYKRKMKQK